MTNAGPAKLMSLLTQSPSCVINTRASPPAPSRALAMSPIKIIVVSLSEVTQVTIECAVISAWGEDVNSNRDFYRFKIRNERLEVSEYIGVFYVLSYLLVFPGLILYHIL